MFVSAGGSAYHRSDCPRLHFGRPLALPEAMAGYTPCAVCKPPRRVAPGAAPAVAPPPGPAAPVAPLPPVAVEPAAARSDRGEPAARRSQARGPWRWIGLGVGAALGFALGGLLYVGEAFDEREGHGNPSGFLVVGPLVGGGVGGFVIGHLLSQRTETALEEGRGRLREALAARAANDAAPPPGR